MYNFVLDADGLIKLAKSGLLPDIAIRSRLLVPEEVFQEVVVEGEKKLHEDAFTIDALIQKKAVRVAKTAAVAEEGVSHGEAAVLRLWKETKNSIIVSDDRRFLSELAAANIPFIVPARLIAAFVQQGSISKPKGREALMRIRSIIREDVYQKALDIIGGDE